MSDTPQANAITTGLQIAQREGGKHVAVLMFADNHMSCQVALPPDAADILGDTLGPQLKEAAAAARRADSGLIIANSVPPVVRNKS